MHCPICGSERKGNGAQNYATGHPLFAPCKLALCSACKSGWVPNPPPVEALKKYYEEEMEGHGFFLDFLKKHSLTLERCQTLARWRFVKEGLEKSGRKWEGTVSVCDIGAGYGTTLEVGRHLGLPLDYFAYESAKARRKKIELLGGVARGDFWSEPFSKRFDLVWASHILEHYSDPGILLGQIRTCMEAGGAGFIEIPCLDYEFKKDWAPHLLFFSVEGLRQAIGRNGFHLLRIESAGPLRRESHPVSIEGGGKKSWKALVRQRLPKFLAPLGSDLFTLYRALASPNPPSLAEDLDNQAFFERWGLENYGGERCWIRALFTSS